MSFVLAGGLQGLGAGLVQQAERAREDRIAKLKREQELQDIESGREFDLRRDKIDHTQQLERDEIGHGRDVELTKMRHGLGLEEMSHADRLRRAGQEREWGREDDLAARVGSLYESLYGKGGTESNGDWDTDNKQGYVGRGQFGAERLSDFSRAHGIGTITPEAFKANSDLQKAVEAWHWDDIEKFIEREGLDRYEGKAIKGIPVTRSGMMAGAHLGGQRGLRRYLESDGREDPKDSNGIHISTYMRKHGGLSVDRAAVGAAIAHPSTPESVRDDLRATTGLGVNPNAGKKPATARDVNGVERYIETGEEVFPGVTREPKPTRGREPRISDSVDEFLTKTVSEKYPAATDETYKSVKAKAQDYLRSGDAPDDQTAAQMAIDQMIFMIDTPNGTQQGVLGADLPEGVNADFTGRFAPVTKANPAAPARPAGLDRSRPAAATPLPTPSATVPAPTPSATPSSADSGAPVPLPPADQLVPGRVYLVPWEGGEIRARWDGNQFEILD